MEPIQDLTWIKQMIYGEVIEKFKFRNLKGVAVKISHTEKRYITQYHYRILFFPKDGNKPVFSLNLESSLLGSYSLTGHIGKKHLNFYSAEETMQYDDFKKWALERAEKIIAESVN